MYFTKNVKQLKMDQEKKSRFKCYFKFGQRKKILL